jgi:hypothetical protein
MTVLTPWEALALRAMQIREPESLLVRSDRDSASVVMELICSNLADRGYAMRKQLDVCLAGYTLQQAGRDELTEDVVGALPGASIAPDPSRTPVPDKATQDDLVLNLNTALQIKQPLMSKVFPALQALPAKVIGP